jgi:hypothetical protein
VGKGGGNPDIGMVSSAFAHPLSMRHRTDERL